MSFMPIAKEIAEVLARHEGAKIITATTAIGYVLSHLFKQVPDVADRARMSQHFCDTLLATLSEKQEPLQ